MKIQPVSRHLDEKLKNPYFRELHQVEEQKLALVKQIVAYRIEFGLNQGQLAKRAGVSQQHISKIEHGDFASVMTLEKVLLAIGYTVELKLRQLKPSIAIQIQKLIQASQPQAAQNY